MARLHVYTAHINPARTQPYETVEFVEEGFNWTAFILTIVWALYHRLWLVSACLVALNVIALERMHNGMLSHSGYGIISLGVHLIVGCYANDWRRAKLARKGFVIADIVTGDSLIRAEQRFFDRYFGTPALSAIAS
jgi:hypothetical protein